jgi:carbonic anhydrase/acetyltransferase-like protein (isoleucine patch superfamily)
MIHCDGPPRDSPAVIGNRVVVGAGVTIHGATLEDECMIGDNSTVLDNAIVRKHSVLAPGSLLGGGKEIKTGELWAGIPARFERKLSDTEIQRISDKAREGVELASVHAVADAKTWQEILQEREDYYETVLRSPYYRQRLSQEVVTNI